MKIPFSFPDEGVSLLDFCVKHLEMLKTQFLFEVRDGKVAPGILKNSGTCLNPLSPFLELVIYFTTFFAEDHILVVVRIGKEARKEKIDQSKNIIEFLVNTRINFTHGF